MQVTTIAVTGFTVRVTVVVLVVSWLEMTVIVTWVGVLTACAVNRPVLSMEPTLAAYVTVVM